MSREERTVFVNILSDLKEKQKTLNSKKLGKLIHHIELYLKKLYKDATGDNLPKPTDDGVEYR